MPLLPSVSARSPSLFPALPAVQTPFNRGVALLHDFWYEEAQRQFEEIAKADPTCAMAHWGAAMSYFHQIWNRPDKERRCQRMGRDGESTVAAG